ncbi:hypothetical protein fHeYen902_167 [Yersinia phage fHe-Yen9-02]|nr:hypothetical protein fHeYen902_167 [Yersinia phage fHe-Yen9-02]
MTQNTAPAKEVDEFNLDDLDIDAAEQKAEQMGAGGGEVLEPSNVCESGACSI